MGRGDEAAKWGKSVVVAHFFTVEVKPGLLQFAVHGEASDSLKDNTTSTQENIHLHIDRNTYIWSLLYISARLSYLTSLLAVLPRRLCAELEMNFSGHWTTSSGNLVVLPNFGLSKLVLVNRRCFRNIILGLLTFLMAVCIL